MRRGTMKIMKAKKKIRGRKRIEKQRLSEREDQQIRRLLLENGGAKA